MQAESPHEGRDRCDRNAVRRGAGVVRRRHARRHQRRRRRAVPRVARHGSRAERFAETGGGANGAALAADGSILVTQNGGIDFAQLDRHRSDAPPVTSSPDDSRPPARDARRHGHRISLDDGFHAPNDLCVAADGTVYFTDPGHYPPPEPNSRPGHRVYERDGTVRTFADGFLYCNGIAFDPDGNARRRRAHAACNECSPTAPRVGDREARPRRRRRLLPRRRRPLLRRVDRSSTASASSSPTAPIVDFWRSRATASRPTAASAAPICARSTSTDAIPGNVVAFEGMPHPRPPPPDLARPRLNRRTCVNGPRRPSATSRRFESAAEVGGEVAGPLLGVFEGPAVFGEVEVLDAEAAVGSRARSRRREHRGEVDDAARVVDVHLRVAAACPGAAARGRRGRAARTDRRPSRRRGRCRRAAAAPGTSARNARTDSVEFTTAPAHGSSSASGRGASTSAPRAPTSRRRRSARASRTSRAAASGTRSGSRSAARATRDRCRAAGRCARSRRPARRAARVGNVAAPRVDDVDDAQRHGTARSAVLTAASTSASTMPTCCRCWPRVLSKSCATSPGVQPPSLPHPRDLLGLLEERVARTRCGRGSGRSRARPPPTRGTRRAARSARGSPRAAAPRPTSRTATAVMRVAPDGATAFTVMPYLPSSSDHTNVMPMIPAFAAP